MPSRFQPPRPASSINAAAAGYAAQAAALRQAGQVAQSVALMIQAIRVDPANAVLCHDLALTFLEIGQPAEAASAFRRAISLKPDFAEAYWRLGLALEGSGDAAAALEAYASAVRLRPSLGEAQYRLADMLEGLGRRTEAIAHFRRAKATARSPSLRRLAEARALMAENRDAEALKALRRAVALEPRDAAALDLLGSVLAEVGAFDEAAECLERALVQAPRMVESYYELVRCRRILPGDNLIERMLAAREQQGLGDEGLLKLSLALGKAYSDVGAYDLAMKAFGAADDIRGRTTRFDLAAFERQAEWEIARFTPELIAKAQELGDLSPRPVMVLGLPRSGTTLCEQILSSHPAVTAGQELTFWNRRGALMQALGPDAPTADFVSKASADYLLFTNLIAAGAARVTDKMPFNFLWAGLIHLAFPNATIIHCRRSPIDTALSIHETFFSPKLNFPTGGEDLVRYYRIYARLMGHWRRLIPPERFVEVDYEALTAEPEPNIRRIIAAVGLPWDEACLQPEANARVVKTASKWQAKQPINRNSVDRWRRYEGHLGPLAAFLAEPRG